MMQMAGLPNGIKAPTNRDANEVRLMNTTSDSSQHEEFGRREFNRKRKVIIRNTPVVTYAEVKAFMGRFAVADISVSKRQQHAIVTLKNGDEAEAVVRELNGTKLLDFDVEVSLYRMDNLMFVTGLPCDIIKDDDGFHSFIEVHGPVEKCFLMRAAEGHSKGYGLIEFAHNREKSEEARRKIDGLKLDSGSSTVRCQFVSDTIISFEQLHSRCLCITKIPADLIEAELKEVCSAVATPTHFQIALADNKHHRFALVEFPTGLEAEHVVRELVAKYTAIHVEYCGPGETPADAYHWITTKSMSMSGFNVCPAVSKLLDNNPQVLQYFQRLLCQLYDNITCQPTVPTVPGSYGAGPKIQSDKQLLTNPGFQMALLAILFAGQQQQQMLPNVGEPMMLQAAAMMEKHYSTAQRQNDTKNTVFPGSVPFPGNVLPTLPSFNVAGPPAMSVPPVNTVLPQVSDRQDSSNKVHPALPPVPFNVTAPPPFPFTPVLQPQNTVGSAPPLAMLPPFGTAFLPNSHMPLIPQNSLPPFGAVLPPTPAPALNAVPFQATHPPLATVLPANTAPALPPSCLPALPPLNLMPPPNSFPPLAAVLPTNSVPPSVPPFGPVIPPNSVPPLSAVPVLSANANSAPLLRTIVPANAVLPFDNITPQLLSSCTSLSGKVIPDFVPPPDVAAPLNMLPVLCTDPASSITTGQHVNSTHVSHEPVLKELSDAASTRNTSVLPSAEPEPGSRKILRAIVGRGIRDQIPGSEAATKSSATESGTQATDVASKLNSTNTDLPPATVDQVSSRPKEACGLQENVCHSLLPESKHHITGPLTERQNVSILKECNVAVGETACSQTVVSIIGHKRSHHALLPHSESTQPVTPVNNGKASCFLPAPEASPEGGYIGQHSQGLGGHYADSYFGKRRKITE